MNFTKILLGVFSIAIILLAVSFWNVREETEGMSATIDNLKEDSSQLAEEKHLYKTLLKADSLLFQRDYKAAMDVLRNLRDQSAMDNYRYDSYLDFVKKKRVEIEQQELKVKTLQQQKEKLEKDLGLSKEVSSILAESRSQFMDSLFVIKDRANVRVRKYRNALRQKEARIDSLLNIHREMLTFENEKGTDIVYLGDVKDGMANGKGIGVWEEGSIYKGRWKDNQRHGEGRFEWADGEVYEGEYNRDKRSGHGVYKWPSGQKYDGEWKDDKRSGYGTLYNEYGNIAFQGEWRGDSPITEKK